jgi:cyclic dehypoxanthinyl futalosine synthase
VRDEQDYSLANTSGGYTAFIAWNFQPDGTPLGNELMSGTTNPSANGELLQIQGLPSTRKDDKTLWRKASGYDYLRTIAVARLLLDNIPHHQASWVTQGPKIAQIGLNFGLDDFGSTMMEENCRFGSRHRFRDARSAKLNDSFAKPVTNRAAATRCMQCSRTPISYQK